MRTFTLILALAALLFSAAIFGFFYAWVCSTMWGLDTADPRIAVAAMQAMNASVRNIVFAPAFFATPFVAALAAAVLWAQQYRLSANLFLLSAGIYLCFGLILTITINVPMNEALAALTVPANIASAEQIWQEYSPRWQFWNIARTIASGIAFLVAALAALHLPLIRHRAPVSVGVPPR